METVTQLSSRKSWVIWGMLLLLTAITIRVSLIELGFLNIVVALGIAFLKSTLVVLYFMHLRYESRVLQVMVLCALIILAIFIGFVFFDIAARYE
jgi:cytochrome c oxidase subunit IV